MPHHLSNIRMIVQQFNCECLLPAIKKITHIYSGRRKGQGNQHMREDPKSTIFKLTVKNVHTLWHAILGRDLEPGGTPGIS